MWTIDLPPSRGRLHARAALLAMLAMLAAAAPVYAQEPASVVVVLDGSGSMAGNIEGVRTSKVLLAQDALRRALAKVAPQTRVGLAAFGHRRGDCGDVELIRQPEPLDAQRLMDAVMRVNPRGRGPLTLALREAARLLPPPGKRTLLLIHDDADNCQQNVCAVAEELRRAGIIAHVVGLGLKPDDATRMACLPQVTGGRLFNVRTPEQASAAVEEALRLAGGDPARVEPPPGLTSGQPGRLASAAPVPASGAPGLYLRALLVPKGDPISVPLHWSVYPEGQPDKFLFTGRATNPQVPVPPGRYVVEARDGRLAAREVVEASDKPTAAFVVLNAGTLQIRAQAQRSGALLGDAIITVSEAGAGGEGKKDAPAGPPLAVFKGGDALALLPAGRYLVRVEQGTVRAERSIVVPAGSQGRMEVPLNAARILLTASGREAGSTDPIVFSVAEDDPDAPKGRREVARSAAPQADFVLPPGTYYVIARQGGVEARESLAVGPGDVARRTLSVAGGRLALATKPAGAAALAPGEPVSYRIERVDGAPAELVTTSRPTPVLLLPPGRYRVEGRYGAMNARTVREVEVKAGQAQQLTLEPQAATLKLRLIGNAAPLLSEVFWTIRDETGATVWTTGQPEPTAVLQAGRYALRAETRDRRFERAIDLRPGESRIVELTTD